MIDVVARNECLETAINRRELNDTSKAISSPKITCSHRTKLDFHKPLKPHQLRGSAVGGSAKQRSGLGP